jgi:hypothetical protein
MRDSASRTSLVQPTFDYEHYCIKRYDENVSSDDGLLEGESVVSKISQTRS